MKSTVAEILQLNSDPVSVPPPAGGCEQFCRESAGFVVLDIFSRSLPVLPLQAHPECPIFTSTQGMEIHGILIYRPVSLFILQNLQV